MSDLSIFHVNKRKDWLPVANYLLTIAAESPLDRPDSENYSKTEAEMWQRVVSGLKAGRVKEMTKNSAAVVYKSSMLISLVMTVEPHTLHLSLVRIIPGSGAMERVNDVIAREAARNLLGGGEERVEGVMPGVRHFYRTIT
jgi:hypothetical protein